MVEIREHLDLIREKSRLSEQKLGETIEIIGERIKLVPGTHFGKWMHKAWAAMRGTDERDVPFLVLALSFPNDGIWSDDRHFQKQSLVKVWTTKELVAHSFGEKKGILKGREGLAGGTHR
ncbi:MAG: hypothetical protein J7J17_02890 [Hadesarchaea archaeon]|nr:hypothetical protein [Hadesarchaea archaeon]